MPTDTLPLLDPGEQACKLDVLAEVDEKPGWPRQLLAVIACGALLGVAAFQLAIIADTVWLSGESTTLTPAGRTGYATGVAVIATIISTTAVGQIRQMWLGRLLRRPTSNRLHKAQLLLQVGTVRVQAQLLWLTMLLLVLGLITTSIVGSTTITTAQRWYSLEFSPFQGRAVQALEPGVDEPWGNECWTSLRDPGKRLAWLNTTSSTYLAVKSAEDHPGNFWCPSGIASIIEHNQVTVHNGYTSNSEGICQTTLDGYVSCSALGAPVNFVSTCGLLSAFGCQLGPTNRACLPVFTRSPVKCNKIDVSLGPDQKVISAQSTCNITDFSQNPPLVFPNGTFKACPTPDNYGSMKFVLAAAEDTDLARLLHWYLQNTTERHAVAAECSLALDHSLSYNVVVNTTYYVDNASSKYTLRNLAVNGTGESCMSGNLSALLDLNTRMTAAATLHDNLLVSNGLFGFFDAGVRTSGFTDGHLDYAPNAWADSDNKLEDYLGVRIAVILSHFWGYNPEGATVIEGAPKNTVEYTVWAARIGTGNWTALLYVIPSLSAAGVILWLLLAK